MNIIRNILAVLIGLVVGSLVNFGVLTVGHMILPPPAGFDGSNMETIANTINVLRPIDFTVPFLAHALGPLVGTLAAMFIAGSWHKTIALILGGIFLLGGIVANYMIPAPMWYRVLDIVIAYIPMALLGLRLSGRGRGEQ